MTAFRQAPAAPDPGPTPDPATLSARELGWSTRGKPIVQGVTLQVHPGEVLGLIGPNGSGKSTLLRLLAGLLRPSAGAVYLDHLPLARMPRREIARSLAFVEQQAETLDRITVRDAVALGRTPWLGPLAPWTQAESAVVDQALSAVEMLDFAARDWATLSGGEQQRVHLARALAQTPRILLLDEPGNHLDIHHQLAMLGLIATLGVTTVIALHDLNQAMGCDRLAVMDQGRLIALGPPAEILTPALLARSFGVRARFLIDPEDGTRVIRFHPL